ncbi:MAG: O-methyltransferase, partial [Gemmatimonadota bacterium]
SGPVALPTRCAPLLQQPSVGARRVLEVGTLAGYSALWIARSLPPEPDGVEPGLVTLEVDPDRADLARRLLDATEVADRIEVRVGEAAALLAEIGPDGSFCAVFLDADKEGLPRYVHHARRLLRVGGLLCVDNALWRGRVTDRSVQDAATTAIRQSHELVSEDPAFDATILPVGDGLLVARRTR